MPIAQMASCGPKLLCESNAKGERDLQRMDLSRFPAKDVRFVVVFFLLISAGSVGGGMDIEYEMTAAQYVRWKDICV